MTKTQIRVTTNFLQGTYVLTEVTPLYCIIATGDIYVVDNSGLHYIVPPSYFD